MPTVLRCTAESFRPIDLKMRPDGARHVANWSNPIIQHGEVDFRDPRRDNGSGRIWRSVDPDSDLAAFVRCFNRMIRSSMSPRCRKSMPRSRPPPRNLTPLNSNANCRASRVQAQYSQSSCQHSRSTKLKTYRDIGHSESSKDALARAPKRAPKNSGEQWISNGRLRLSSA